MAEASKEIRSWGRDSKGVVMPRREGYCGYIASSCTRLPTVASFGGSWCWCRACLYSRRGAEVQRAHEAGGEQSRASGHACPC